MFTPCMIPLPSYKNRVIVHSVSVVLGLGTLIDTPYLAGFVVALGGSDNLLMSL